MSKASALVAAVMSGFYDAHSENKTGSAVTHVVKLNKDTLHNAEFLYELLAGHGPSLERLYNYSLTHGPGAPNVFAYGVAEPFGRWLYNHMIEGAVPTVAQQEEKPANLSYDFMIRDGNSIRAKIERLIKVP